ncbi:hypothetical protein AM500_19770 [Bacillus sp. FJAT-18017]|uniref:hypothetical protein n=1 Tax=Bacillus sp. FJAT-18017 TaxID=1705566 RepID=UPI0006B064CB|nr:hypothetical protein [Bacillus sp. FJAT-18017]ALC91770.1 hypothetical protein AM500_19770 [Bacillus sp. FJAT-18017]
MGKYIAIFLGILFGINILGFAIGVMFGGGGGDEAFFLGVIIILLLTAILTVLIYMINFIKKELWDIRMLSKSIKKDTKVKKEGA